MADFIFLSSASFLMHDYCIYGYRCDIYTAVGWGLGVSNPASSGVICHIVCQRLVGMLILGKQFIAAAILFRIPLFILLNITNCFSI